MEPQVITIPYQALAKLLKLPEKVTINAAFVDLYGIKIPVNDPYNVIPREGWGLPNCQPSNETAIMLYNRSVGDYLIRDCATGLVMNKDGRWVDDAIDVYFNRDDAIQIMKLAGIKTCEEVKSCVHYSLIDLEAVHERIIT